MFVGPPEVHRELLKHSGKKDGEIDGYDIVSWCLEQSCRSIERAQPLRVLQGLSYACRMRAMKNFLDRYGAFDEAFKDLEASSTAIISFREREQQHLVDLYAPFHMKALDVPDIIQISQRSDDPTVQKLLRIWKSLRNPVGGATFGEEHEREIAHEVERETQIQRPPRAEPMESLIDPKLEDFVTKGDFGGYMQFSTGYDAIFDKTSIKPLGDLGDKLHPWHHIRVTEGFANTVEQPPTGFYDNFLRPVNYILTNKEECEPTMLLIVSPREVNTFLRDIQSSTSKVRLRIYEPRVARIMRSVDFGSDPPSESMEAWQDLNGGLRRELHLFAGQLYFNTYEEHQKVLRQ